MDYSFRPKLYGHLECVAVLLRYVFAVQRCRASLRFNSCFLALLDVSYTLFFIRRHSSMRGACFHTYMILMPLRYYVNPSTWWISGVLAKTLDGIPVECTSSETAMFNVPAGQTCQSYAGAFADSAGGYLLNPEATANCEYCPYRLANGYLATLNIQAGDAWRDLGIFCVFVVSNWALVYFFIYTVRIKGWTFGFGPLFGALGKMVGVLKKPFQSKKKE